METNTNTNTGSRPTRPRNRTAVAMALAGAALILGGCHLADRAGGGATIGAERGAGAIPSWDRIASWLGGPGTAEREELRSWLAARGVGGSEALWLASATRAELDEAVADLGIPHFTVRHPTPNGREKG